MQRNEKGRTMKDMPIGIFDSGLGGLTVMSQIMKLMPCEDIIYFGDTARVPYGSKSQESIIKYSMQIASFLLEKKVKIIVVACNTASALALPSLRKKLSVPVIGVIEPGAKYAVNATRNGRIGIIGTEGTINSSSYVKEIKRIDIKKKAFTQACPLFVPLVEEGWLSHPITYLIIEEYLKALTKKNIDTLILGCTHYPLIKKAIQKKVGKKTELVDSASATAGEVLKILKKDGLKSERQRKARYQFFVSDSPKKFQHVGQRFLGKLPMWVKKINLEEK
ncbi:MAG: glutamate racemase [Endomicrobiales bacterium]|nr:glutamate racemase [Endomicrobiales bacterium]